MGLNAAVISVKDRMKQDRGVVITYCPIKSSDILSGNNSKRPTVVASLLGEKATGKEIKPLQSFVNGKG